MADTPDIAEDHVNRAGDERHGHHWAWRLALIAAIVLAAVTLVGCCCTHPTTTTTYRPADSAARDASARAAAPIPPVSVPDSVTIVEMQDVHFRVDSALTLRIHRLKGTMQAREGWQVINFGEPRSFRIHIRDARVGMSPEDLQYLLNRYVFNYEGAPITVHEIQLRDSLLWQSGTLHKLVDIPFEMTAQVQVTPDGLIRLHPVSMKICDLPGMPLMKTLGLQLDELLDLSKAEGVRVEGNDLLLDPAKVLPPPAISGTLTGVRVAEGELVQLFGTPGDTTTWQIAERPTPPDPAAENYMFYRGGVLRFGKLFMVRADLQIIDADPTDPFNFYLDEYKSHLVAGYSRTLPDFGLKVYMPDYPAVGPTVEPPEKIELQE